MTTVVFFPELPHDKYIIHKLCGHLGWTVTNSLERAERLVVTFCDRTLRDPISSLEELPGHVRVVNRGAIDIRKSRVERAFNEAFGYGSLLDPRRHHGKCVVKSETNARRDGRIVACPLDTTEEGVVYQLAVDNRDAEGTYFDYRVPVFSGVVPLVYVCRRTEEARFRGPDSSCSLLDARDAFSQDELRAIAHFCTELHFEYGELDVVRDRGDGRLYVLDANHTPYGPPDALSRTDKDRAIARLADELAAFIR